MPVVADRLARRQPDGAGAQRAGAFALRRNEQEIGAGHVLHHGQDRIGQRERALLKAEGLAHAAKPGLDLLTGPAGRRHGRPDADADDAQQQRQQRQQELVADAPAHGEPVGIG